MQGDRVGGRMERGIKHSFVYIVEDIVCHQQTLTAYFYNGERPLSESDAVYKVEERLSVVQH